MGAGHRAMMAKQWRPVWRNAWRHPRRFAQVLPTLLRFRTGDYYFVETGALYAQTKSALFARDFAQARKLFRRTALRYPLAMLSPQWMYLAKRLITRNSKPY
jgi:hypothetical protein